MTTISIIVAVYNGEPYLQRCLDSLCRQTYKDIEILCVNDGSTDGSADIIRRQMEADKRIRLLEHDANLGPAKAWNTAIAAATGEVVGFLDSDDWYDDDTVERLMAVFALHDDADCVLYRCIHVDSDMGQTDYSGLSFRSLEGQEAFRESLHWAIHGVYAARVWLFRQFPVDDSCRLFSCDNTTRIHYYNSRRVYQSNANYYYLANPDSISHRATPERMDYLRATSSMKRQLTAMNVGRDILCLYERERLRVLVDCYLFYFNHRRQFSAGQRRYCRDQLKAALESLDSSLLHSHRRLPKFGYMTCRKSWTLFRLQEETYFLMKKLTGRL